MFGWGEAVKGVTDLVGKFVEDPDKANELETEIKKSLMGIEKQLIQSQTAVIVAEAKSQSFIAKNWRPMIMLIFGAIILNNYILFPYIQLFGGTAIKLDLPPAMWELLKIGIGGYIVRRTGEKMVDTYAKNRN